MRYYHFKKDEFTFDGQLISEQCVAINKNGSRCKNNVVIGVDMCHVHKKSILHLTIKKSNIPNAGSGLFCHDPKNKGIVFKKGNKICDYNGEIIDNSVLNERFHNGNADYVVQLYNKLYEDASLRRGIGSLSNRSKHVNARLSIKKNNQAQLLATKNIRHGDEIYIGYGRSYRLDLNDISVTNAKRNM
jgi:hypothetical protein